MRKSSSWQSMKDFFRWAHGLFLWSNITSTLTRSQVPQRNGQRHQTRGTGRGNNYLHLMALNPAFTGVLTWSFNDEDNPVNWQSKTILYCHYLWIKILTGICRMGVNYTVETAPEEFIKQEYFDYQQAYCHQQCNHIRKISISFEALYFDCATPSSPWYHISPLKISCHKVEAFFLFFIQSLFIQDTGFCLAAK